MKWAKELLKKHGLTDKEVLFNPVTGKDIVGPDGKGVMTGPQYIYKLFKSTETNYSARSVEDYDVNLQPAKGGTEGAKALGRMEVSALIAHDARNVLRDAATLKSRSAAAYCANALRRRQVHAHADGRGHQGRQERFDADTWSHDGSRRG